MTHWFRPIGVAAVLVAALAYESAESRPIFGRWSLMYGGLLVALLLVLAVAVRAALRRRGGIDHQVPRRAVVLDWAVLAYGLGYLIGDGAGRIADLDLFGSTRAISIVLEWVALAGLVGWGLSALVSRIRSELGKGLLTMVGSFASLALLGEGFLRAQAVVAPRVEGVPSVSTRRWLDKYVHRNSLGYRDLEPPAAVDTTRRVMIVGDSFAMGWGLPELRTRFGEQLAGALAERTGTAWRPLTIAEANRHTLHQIDMLGDGIASCPDLVVLVYVFNDMDYLRPSSRSRMARMASVPLGLAFVNSHLVQKSTLLLRVLLASQSDRLIEASPYSDDALLARHLDDLSRLVDLASGEGAQSVIVPFDVVSGAVPAAAERYERFVSAGQQHGLPVVAIDSVFEGLAVEDLTISQWDRHPSALAHGLAAEAVAARLTETPLPERPACAQIE